MHNSSLQLRMSGEAKLQSTHSIPGGLSRFNAALLDRLLQVVIVTISLQMKAQVET